MKNATMPKSKAKTAYGLLSEIRALILAEPLRYDQRCYLDRGEGGSFPSCGTVGCVAGWTYALKGPQRDALDPTVNRFSQAH